jgi:hypothetical protein
MGEDSKWRASAVERWGRRREMDSVVVGTHPFSFFIVRAGADTGEMAGTMPLYPACGTKLSTHSNFASLLERLIQPPAFKKIFAHASYLMNPKQLCIPTSY